MNYEFTAMNYEPTNQRKTKGEWDMKQRLELLRHFSYQAERKVITYYVL